MTVMATVVLSLSTLSILRTSTIANEASRTAKRVEVTEKEIQDIIEQGKLSCPDRAKFRHAIRLGLLDGAAEPLIVYINKELPEIVCENPPTGS